MCNRCGGAEPNVQGEGSRGGRVARVYSCLVPGVCERASIYSYKLGRRFYFIRFLLPPVILGFIEAREQTPGEEADNNRNMGAFDDNLQKCVRLRFVHCAC